jgi:hypothetical protein
VRAAWRASKDERPTLSPLASRGSIRAVALRGSPKKVGSHLRVTEQSMSVPP